jgi:hypothetical protein
MYTLCVMKVDRYILLYMVYSVNIPSKTLTIIFQDKLPQSVVQYIG